MPINKDDIFVPGEEDEDSPRAIRRLLERLGVDVGFWKNHADRIEADDTDIRGSAERLGCELEEAQRIVKQVSSLADYEFDSQEEREEKTKVRTLLAKLADEITSQLEPQDDKEILESVTELLDPTGDWAGFRKFRGFPGVVLLIADGLVRTERFDAAKTLYSLAIDLAPTPQAQMEIAYLLASRGAVQFPGSWAYASLGYSPSILLLPDQWMGHDGVQYLEVIYEELLPGPSYPDRMAILRLALEGYGRVFAHAFPWEETGETSDRDAVESPLKPFIIDGLHTLLAAVDEYDSELVHTCLMTLFDWSSHYGDVETRLRISETYLQGYKNARTGIETAEAVDRNTRRTMITDPSRVPIETADAVIERLRLLPPLERNEIEDRFRGHFTAVLWDQCPVVVRNYLVPAESEYRRRQAEKAADFCMAVCSFARAVEAYLCWSTGVPRSSLGKFTEEPHLSQLSARLRRSDQLPGLIRQINELSPLRNRACHGGLEYLPIPEGEADRARRLSLSITEILLRQVRNPRGRRQANQGGADHA